MFGSHLLQSDPFKHGDDSFEAAFSAAKNRKGTFHSVQNRKQETCTFRKVFFARICHLGEYDLFSATKDPFDPFGGSGRVPEVTSPDSVCFQAGQFFWNLETCHWPFRWVGRGGSDQSALTWNLKTRVWPFLFCTCYFRTCFPISVHRNCFLLSGARFLDFQKLQTETKIFVWIFSTAINALSTLQTQCSCLVRRCWSIFGVLSQRVCVSVCVQSCFLLFQYFLCFFVVIWYRPVWCWPIQPHQEKGRVSDSGAAAQTEEGPSSPAAGSCKPQPHVGSAHSLNEEACAKSRPVWWKRLIWWWGLRWFQPE